MGFRRKANYAGVAIVVIRSEMPTSFIFESSLCGHKSRATATASGTGIALALESSCPLLRDYGKSLGTIKIKDLAKRICENPIYIKATEGNVHPNCIVPCGVAMCAWAEAGLVSKSLLEKFPSQCITYQKVG